MLGLSSSSFRIVVILCALFFGLTAVFYTSMYRIYTESQGEIDNLEPRLSRLLGVLTAEQELKVARDESDHILASHIYVDGEESVLTSQMQQDIRALFEEVGLNIHASQILQSKNSKGLIKLFFDITASGTTEGLKEALGALEEKRPNVYLEEATIRPKRYRRGTQEEQNIDVRLRMFVLKGGV